MPTSTSNRRRSRSRPKDDIFVTVNVTGRGVQARRGQARRHLGGAEEELRRTVLVKPGETFQEADHNDPGADPEPARHGRLRLRQGRPGADPDDGQEGRADRSSSTRATASTCATSFQRRHQDQRRGAARDAPARGRLVVERAGRALKQAPTQRNCRTSRRWSRRPNRFQARPTWSTSSSRSKGGTRRSSAAVSATRVPVVHPERQLRRQQRPRHRRARIVDLNPVVTRRSTASRTPSRTPPSTAWRGRCR